MRFSSAKKTRLARAARKVLAACGGNYPRRRIW
jgi:hypothetical protein